MDLADLKLLSDEEICECLQKMIATIEGRREFLERTETEAQLYSGLLPTSVKFVVEDGKGEKREENAQLLENGAELRRFRNSNRNSFRRQSLDKR